MALANPERVGSPRADSLPSFPFVYNRTSADRAGVPGRHGGYVDCRNGREMVARSTRRSDDQDALARQFLRVGRMLQGLFPDAKLPMETNRHLEKQELDSCGPEHRGQNVTGHCL